MLDPLDNLPTVPSYWRTCLNHYGIYLIRFDIVTYCRTTGYDNMVDAGPRPITLPLPHRGSGPIPPFPAGMIPSTHVVFDLRSLSE